MSEFSAAVLTLAAHDEALRSEISARGIEEGVGFVYRVSNPWIGLFLADEWFMQHGTLPLIVTISQRIPLMHFIHAEDHGWHVTVYVNGEIVFKLVRSYDSQDANVVECSDWSIWRVFGLRESEIEQVRAAVSGESFEDVERFKDALGLSEFSWMSYSYLIDEIED